MTVRVAAIQLALGKGSYNKAVENAAGLIHRAKSEGAQIVCLPEHWLLEYRELGYNAVQELTPVAQSNRVYLITGANYTQAVSNGSKTLRIRSVLLGPDGQMLGKQDKVHLFREEKNAASPGEGYQVFPTPLGNIGISVCYDNAFPEAARTLSLNGADLLFVPSRIIANGLDPWILYLRTRSLENRIPVIAPNVFHPPRYAGGSIIIDPKLDDASGVVTPEIVASATTGETAVIADVNVDMLRTLRRERLNERQPEAYKL